MARDARLWMGITAVVLLLLAWQTWTVSGLRGEVAALRDEAAFRAAQPPPPPQITPSSPHAPPARADQLERPRPSGRVASSEPRQPGDLRAPPALSPALQPAAIKALQRVKETHFDDNGDWFVRERTEQLEGLLDELVRDGQVPASVRPEVSELAVAHLNETWDIKSEAQSGVLSERDAVTEWQDSREHFLAELTGLVGPEVAGQLLDGRAGTSGGGGGK